MQIIKLTYLLILYGSNCFEFPNFLIVNSDRHSKDYAREDTTDKILSQV